MKNIFKKLFSQRYKLPLEVYNEEARKIIAHRQIIDKMENEVAEIIETVQACKECKWYASVEGPHGQYGECIRPMGGRIVIEDYENGILTGKKRRCGHTCFNERNNTGLYNSGYPESGMYCSKSAYFFKAK